MDHLRPVPEPEHAPPGSTRRDARPRPDKSLPTDRMKLGMQIEALRAIAVVSDYGKRAVGGADIAPALGLVPATAALNNQFFMESGLIVREKKGRYKPTEAVVRFAQGYDFNATEAGQSLAPVLKKTWFFEEVVKALKLSNTRERVIEVLAYAAGTSKDRYVQLGSLLGWLEYARLIVAENGKVRLSADAAVVPDPPENPPADPADPKGEAATTPEDKQPQRETPPNPDERKSPAGATVVALSFDLALTAADLHRLSPEQITSLFEAVGRVAAIKGAINTT